MVKHASAQTIQRRSFGLVTISALVLAIGLTAGAGSASASTATAVPGVTVSSASLTATPTPVVAGSAKIGQNLTATAGVWKPASVSLSYQWKRGGAAIAGATARTYAVAAADLGKTLTVTITGKRPGYLSVGKTSAPTAAVTATLTKTPVPVITGSVRVGQTLTATAGTWAPAPVVLNYQWKRAGVSIPGATGRTYTVRPTDADAGLTVTVTGKRASYVTVSKQSAGTAKAAGLAYKNCTALVAVYPHGVAKAGIKVNLANGVPRALKGPPYFSTAVYNLNSKSDRDKDGIACER